MPRLRNVQSGAIVSVPDEKVARLGSGWEPAGKPAAKAPAPAEKSAEAPAIEAPAPVKKTAAKKAAARKPTK